MIKYQLINDDINSFDAWCISSRTTKMYNMDKNAFKIICQLI